MQSHHYNDVAQFHTKNLLRPIGWRKVIQRFVKKNMSNGNKTVSFFTLGSHINDQSRQITEISFSSTIGFMLDSFLWPLVGKSYMLIVSGPFGMHIIFLHFNSEIGSILYYILPYFRTEIKRCNIFLLMPYNNKVILI